MGWREAQRKHRKRLAEAASVRLRRAWADATPQEQIDFLAELEANASTPRAAQVFRDMRPVEQLPPAEPENPAYNAAVQRHGGDPLTRAMLGPTALIEVYRGGER